MKHKTYQTSAKSKDSKMVIELGKVSTGHQQHDQGCGRHDSRPKRLRTRQAQRQRWSREY